MATGLTKTALTRLLAEKQQLTNKQAASFLDLLAETAIKETKKNGVFVIPGIGRLVKAERKARIGRNPQTLSLIHIFMQKVRPADLARRMKVTPQEVNRLTDLRYGSKIDGIAAAAKALNKTLEIRLV